jgi:hypothetical protein
MNVKGIIWVGSMADDLGATTRFFSEVLEMPVFTDVEGFIRLAAENGDRLELFGPNSVEHSVLDAGPVAGFWVENAEEARRELMAAGASSISSGDSSQSLVLPSISVNARVTVPVGSSGISPAYDDEFVPVGANRCVTGDRTVRGSPT